MNNKEIPPQSNGLTILLGKYVHSTLDPRKTPHLVVGVVERYLDGYWRTVLHLASADSGMVERRLSDCVLIVPTAQDIESFLKG